MKALILAAGMGTRLAPLTNNLPKSLVTVNGKPILVKQIENLYENNIIDITVIAGYKADILKDRINVLFPQVKIIINENFANTNNMYSAFLGKDSIGNSDFLMMNSDVFYDSSVIKALLNTNASNAIVTDIGRYIEESMKVVQKDNRLVQISKQVSKMDALGSSIDVYKFSHKAGQAFFNKCSQYINDKKQVKLWSEIALNDILPQVLFEACPLVGNWVEIDNSEDLSEAERIFK